MLEFDVETVEKMISKSPRMNGSFNLFFKLNDKIGVKLCLNKEHRDSNYNLQTKAATFQLGPDTYGTIDNVVYEGRKYFGYFTEIVQVIEDDEYDRLAEEGFLDFIDEEEGDELYSQIKEKVFDWPDYHSGNIGWKNGKLVCIDFDDFRSVEARCIPY